MVYTPGQRISTRSEDFIINESIRDGENWILKVEGISELVKGQRFVFDTNIDKEIRISDPKNTVLQPDTDYGYRKTKLFIENQIQQVYHHSTKSSL